MGWLLHPQADPQAGVGVDLAGQVALEVLRDEEQVEPERTADAGDRLELLQLLAPTLGGEQLTELVDDDEQAGQRRQVGPRQHAPPGTTPRCSPQRR